MISFGVWSIENQILIIYSVGANITIQLIENQNSSALAGQTISIALWHIENEEYLFFSYSSITNAQGTVTFANIFAEYLPRGCL